MDDAALSAVFRTLLKSVPDKGSQACLAAIDVVNPLCIALSRLSARYLSGAALERK